MMMMMAHRIFLCMDVGGLNQSINCILHINFTAEKKKLISHHCSSCCQSATVLYHALTSCRLAYFPVSEPWPTCHDTAHIHIPVAPGPLVLVLLALGTGTHSSLYSTAQVRIIYVPFCQLSQGPTSCLTWGRSMGR